MAGTARSGIGRHGGWRSYAALAVFLLAAGEAQAAGNLCRQLESQLASAGSGQAARYEAAIAKQREQIAKARGQARRAGCGRTLFGAPAAACASLDATLGKMQTNLAALQTKRAGMAGKRDRAKILAALDSKGCRQAKPNQADRKRQEDQPRQRAVTGGGERRIGGLTGNFRTLCVRTSDGYFFPVSYGVSSRAFERDQNACAAMCPGTELYYHRVPGEEPADMVSASTGLPYSQMANAWRYRDADARSAPGCGADSARERGFEVIGGSYRSDGVSDAASTAAIPLPAGRPDPAEDPETLANREGGLTIETLRRLADPTAARKAGDRGEWPVRVVGPAFLPDPEAAIDLRVQDRPAGR